MLNLKSNRMIGVAFLIVLAAKIFEKITHINTHIFPWSISENDLEFFIIKNNSQCKLFVLWEAA